jgi:hypothetical protein
MIFTVRDRKVIIDADLATLYAVPTKALNQAVKRNADRFPRDFAFRLTAKEQLEVVTNCDHLARLKFSRTLPMAFTEHGAIMAATVLNSPQAVSMSVFVVRVFIQLREHIVANTAILKRLSEIDRTLLQHDTALLDLYEKLLPLLEPPEGCPSDESASSRRAKHDADRHGQLPRFPLAPAVRCTRHLRHGVA